MKDSLLLNDIDSENFFLYLIKTSIATDKYSVSILGWEDGDYFNELCNDNGGPKGHSVELFKNMPLGITFSNIYDLKVSVMKYCDEKYLGSKNGLYKFIFDIYVWQSRKFYIYNPYLNKLFKCTLNVFEILIGNAISPPWINDHIE